MQFSEKHCDSLDSLGLYVVLEFSPDNRVRLRTEIASLYRWEVRVGLPPGRRESWKDGLLQALLRAESGMRFPVRFEQDNLLEFLSMEELKQIEKQIKGVTFYVYGVQKTYGVDNSLLRKIKYRAQQSTVLSNVT